MIMMPELGYVSLIAAMLLAVLQAAAGIGGCLSGRPVIAAAMAAGAVRGQFAAVAFSFAALVYAHMTSDFSVLNVVSSSNSQLPLLYKFAGSWGSHEGSMMLWVLVLSFFGLALPSPARAFTERDFRLRLGARGMQGLIGASFLIFIVCTSEPFLRILPAAPEGEDLNPILQDPALAFHPPLLYLGYVGFSSVFALAASGLLTRTLDRSWALLARPFVLGAWTCLTLGIALGSHWAYTELGWGGWWFWDPVENAALIPWLSGTALLHALIVMEKRGNLKDWTAFLALLTFILSLIGTFLVRSGVITSVHAFASDPSRGLFILALLAFLGGGGLLLFAIRAQGQGSGARAADFSFLSREGLFVFNNLFLTAIAATVVIGTVYPYMLELLTGHVISVGPPYFNRTAVPLAVPLFACMAIAPWTGWHGGKLASLRPLLFLSLALSALVIGLCALWLHGWPPIAWPFAFLAVAIGASVVPRRGRDWPRLLRDPRRLGMSLAHAGFAIALLGMTGDSFGKLEQTVGLAVGDSVAIGPDKVTLENIREAAGPNYRAAQAVFRLNGLHDPAGAAGSRMVAERRFYPAAGQDVTQAAISTNGLADLYIAMGDAVKGPGTTAKEQIGFRLSYHPLLPLLWGGALLTVLGSGLVLLTSLRSLYRRRGQPGRRHLGAQDSAIDAMPDAPALSGRPAR